MIPKPHLKLGVAAGVTCLLLGSIGSQTPIAAASLTSMEVQLERVVETVASKHTVYLVTNTGLSAGGTITITYPGSSFAFGASYNYTDMQLAVGNSANCETATFTSQTLAASPSGTTYGASYASQVVTITSGTGTVSANTCVRVILNSNGAGHTLTNPTIASNQSYVINSTVGSDAGSAAVVILDSSTTPAADQVQLTAQVLPTISMDIDVAYSNCVNSTETIPVNNIVDLGVLFPGQLNVSNSSIKFICLDLSTNIPAGMKVLVRSSRSNAVGGLVGPGDVIGSVTADLNSPLVNEGYGLRVSSVGVPTTGSFTSSTPFDAVTTGSIGQLPGALGAAAQILSSSNIAETSTGNRIAIEVAAKARTTNVVGVYTDTIIFTAMVNL